MRSNVFLLAGRTGGPLIPILAVAKNLTNQNPIIIGIKNGVEQKFAEKLKMSIVFLPETKLRLLSHSKSTSKEKVTQYLESVSQIFKLVWAILKSLFYILKYKPAMIISAGSFLTVPVFVSAYILKRLRLSKTVLVLHQQDPDPGLASRIGIRFSDIKTCVFEETKKYPNFNSATIIPNPIDTQSFSEYNINQLSSKYPGLFSFISSKSKPLLLVFGGGSGSEVINNWVKDNLSQLTDKFRVLHLSGIYQSQKSLQVKSSDYYVTDGLFEEMPLALHYSNLVLCRSGLGSITELLYLNKPAYLIPMKHSHQEANAKAVGKFFQTLDQDESGSWIHTISTTYPQVFQNINFPSPELTQNKLNHYYATLQQVLDKNAESRPNA